MGHGVIVVDGLAVGPALQFGGNLRELGVDRTVDAAGSACVLGPHVLSA